MNESQATPLIQNSVHLQTYIYLSTIFHNLSKAMHTKYQTCLNKRTILGTQTLTIAI